MTLDRLARKGLGRSVWGPEKQVRKPQGRNVLSVFKEQLRGEHGGSEGRSRGDVGRDQKMLESVSHNKELGFFFCQWRVLDGGVT